MATTAKTFKFKLYASARRNRKLHQQINAAGMVYNHCIALHKRYYSLFHKSLNKFALQKHLTKIKRIERFSYLKEIGSQAVQDITDRVDRAYKLFFEYTGKRKIRPVQANRSGLRKTILSLIRFLLTRSAQGFSLLFSTSRGILVSPSRTTERYGMCS